MSTRFNELTRKARRLRRANQLKRQRRASEPALAMIFDDTESAAILLDLADIILGLIEECNSDPFAEVPSQQFIEVEVV